MTEKTQISTTKTQEVENADNKHYEFKKRTVRLSALACSIIKDANFNIEEADRKIQEGLKALGSTGGLQEMLVAQMLSIHHLQQHSMAIATNLFDSFDLKQYFTNTAIKLANTFVQQATLLNKLQGHGGQKIIVEHVDVHHGGQAIVANIDGGVSEKKK